MFAVDPYAEVYQFRDNLHGIYTESLDGMGNVWSFLIARPEKALLIDTSFGLGGGGPGTRPDVGAVEPQPQRACANEENAI